MQRNALNLMHYFSKEAIHAVYMHVMQNLLHSCILEDVNTFSHLTDNLSPKYCVELLENKSARLQSRSFQKMKK